MATYYIAPNGNDATGDGSEALPWYNLITAIKGSVSGDTIIIKQGTYNGQLAGDTTPATRLRTRTIVGETNDPHDTVLDFQGNDFQFNGSTATASDVITVKNFTLKSAGAFLNSGIFSPVLATLIIENMILDECIGSSSTNINGVLGIIARCPKMTMDKVLIINPLSKTFGPEATIFGWDSGQHDVVIRNCVIYIGDLAPPLGARVVNWFNLSNGENQTGTIQFQNTIVFKTGDPLPFTRFMGDNLLITFENCCVKEFDLSNGDEPTFINSIFTDPLFVDADNGNFRLRPTSPCIGTGGL